MEFIKTRDEFVKIINELGLKKGAEIGVAKGDFSTHLLKNSQLDILYSIDAWSEDLESMKAYRTHEDVLKVNAYYKEAKNKLSQFGKRSIMIKDISENAVKQFENDTFDFIYLDASHLFSGFSLDLINWWPKLKWGGLFAGHDFIRKPLYQVSYAINGFCFEHKQFYYLTTGDTGKGFSKYPANWLPNPSWWLIKTKRNKDAWVKEMPEHKKILFDQHKELEKYLKADIPYEYIDNETR